MGTWGFGLYENDLSLDVKDEFEELYKEGKTAQEITDKLTEEYRDIMGDIEEEPLFWLALADTQWDSGVLLPSVKEKALFWLNICQETQRTRTMDGVAEARKGTLDDLREKLLSPQPPMKKVRKGRRFICPWKLGDVFAWQLESDQAKERGLYGRYLLIQKVDEGTWYPGHIVPIVYVKITKDANLPANVEEYDQLEYVQISFSKYEERFWPIDMRRPQEDIAEKAKIDYQVDEYGFLPQYRITLIHTSKKAIPESLIYVGNFANAARPQKEFVPHVKVNIVAAAWKKFETTFETIVLKRYFGHNHRELSIYRNAVGDKGTALFGIDPTQIGKS